MTQRKRSAAALLRGAGTILDLGAGRSKRVVSSYPTPTAGFERDKAALSGDFRRASQMTSFGAELER